MKKLKYDPKTKEYRGLAFVGQWAGTQILIVAPNFRDLNRIFKRLGTDVWQQECDPKLCKKVTVTRWATRGWQKARAR